MPLVDFEGLFLKADNLRNNAQVDEAVTAYKEIADLATESDELRTKGFALHMAGVSAKENVNSATSSYLRDALSYFEQAEIFYRQAGSEVDLGVLDRDRAIVCDYAGLHDQAAAWFQKSLLTLTKVNDIGHLGITYSKYGLHYFRVGDYEAAQTNMAHGLSLIRQDPSATLFYATSLFDSARVHFKTKDLVKAQDMAEEALSWFEADHGERKYDRRLAQVNGLLALIYYQQGQSKNAKACAKRYRQLLKTFHPLAAKVIENELESLTDENPLN